MSIDTVFLDAGGVLCHPSWTRVADALKRHGVTVAAHALAAAEQKATYDIDNASVIGSTVGPASLLQGIRPDTLLIIGQFDHWATPYAKTLNAPSLNTIAPMSLELTDATGSGADIVRVRVRRVGRA